MTQKAVDMIQLEAHPRTPVLIINRLAIIPLGITHRAILTRDIATILRVNPSFEDFLKRLFIASSAVVCESTFALNILFDFSCASVTWTKNI